MTAEEVKEYLKARSPSTKIPEYVDFMAELPKNQTTRS
jgi:acyl-coenzyme A synthetase/AMP-(fatty) acid ligase